MNLTRYVLYLFAVFCLGFGLIFSSLSPAFAAGLTITIDGTSGVGGTVSHDVGGNGVGPDGDITSTAVSSATGNSVYVNSGGTVDGSVHGGYAYPGTGSATATGNSVFLNGGTVTTGRNINGGYANASTTGSATAAGNSVTISGGTAGSVYGALANSVSGLATATGNSVTITGGTVGAVRGGVVGSFDGPATASNNSVIISGGTVTGDAHGGYASSMSGGIATATNNTVTISGNPTFGATTILYGGYAMGAISGDNAFTGNTLNLKTSGISVAGMASFQYLNFYLPSTLAAGGTMLTVTGDAHITNTTVNVGIDGASTPLQTGDQVILIDASAGDLVGTPVNTTANGSGMQGVTLKYEFDIIADNANGLLTATMTGTDPQVNEQTKSLSEGFAANAALVNTGADFAAGSGMGWATGAAGQKGGGFGFGSFGGIGGGRSKHKTGSHVDMSSISLLAGFAWGQDFKPGRLTLGAFFEYGNGSYDTYNSFSNAASVKGKGDMYNIGGGLLGRFDANCGGYLEASFRAGGLHNEYKNGDLRDDTGRQAEYDSSSAYYGFHLGSGYIWNMNDKASLDLYAKYFWTRVEGDSVKLSTGDPVTFKDTDSSRLRFGSRFAYAVNEFVSPYIGAAYEHEFDGKARAATNGFDIPAPSMRGDTGIGELGLVLKPSQTLPLSFDVGVQGYTGKREGVTGSLQMKYEF